jgi:DNA-binding MarR family transcriptional regulator
MVKSTGNPAAGKARTPQSRALIALLTSADRVQGYLTAIIEPHGVTFQQYNVLRILRGADAEGLPTLSIAQRMMERAPGITRIIDRLEAKRLVARERRDDDRRCVHCRITADGLGLLAGLDGAVDDGDRRAFASLSPDELAALTTYLERLRDAHRPRAVDETP